MTPASRRALERLRDLPMPKWHEIPPMVCTFYVYTLEEESAS